MKKEFLLLSLIIFFSFQTAVAQSDTIYTNTKKIVAKVVEITPNTVKFHYPNETLSNSIYKNKIRKIAFHNGRLQKFKLSSFAEIKSIEDYDKVVLTESESSIEGLRQVGHILAAAQGRTALSSSKKMKKRAYKNLKLQAAMLGANVVFLGESKSERGKMGTAFSPTRTTKTELSGFAYSTNYLDIDKFKSKIGTKKSFSIVTKYKLKSTKTNIKKYNSNSNFVINKITKEGDNIYIYGHMDGKWIEQRYQLSRFNDKSFGIYHTRKKKEYYYKMKF